MSVPVILRAVDAVSNSPEACKICGSATAPFGRATVLAKYPVQYFQCSSCRFVQTETPYWLAEAYATSLIAADTGSVQRSLRLAETTQVIVQQFFNPSARFLDYGGGYGLFVRLMRDRGFDFLWSDRYATNIHAVGFEADAAAGGFELVTAFEVLEHLTDPVREIGDILRRGSAVLFTTELLPPRNPPPGDWWYYALGGGQHVSIYTLQALDELARRFGVELTSDGKLLHLFSWRRVSSRALRFVTRPAVARGLNALRRRTSLIASDFQRVTGTAIE